MNAPTKPPVVLHVSDSSGPPDATTSALSGAGMEVLVARDVEAALALARQALPDVVLFDRAQAEAGEALARGLRAEPVLAGTPVAFASRAPVPAETKQRAFDAGADAYLTPLEAGELVAVVRSLARLRRAETDARRQAEELRASDQRKDEFIATLGHELRNPLSAVRTGLTLLEGDVTAERAARVRATIGRQTERLVRLVDDLLDLARITHGKLRLETAPIDLRDVVLGAAEATRSAFEEQGVGLAVSCATAMVQGDAARLEQVVANLLDNALKYTPSGGCVEVALSAGGGRARLRVADTGVGIDQKHLEGLFRPFFQGDTSQARREGGLGIGLTVVHRLVEAHGGTAGVSSGGPGRGSEFTAELPLLPEVAAAPAGPRTEPAAGTGRAVLLVDDHADSRELFEEILRGMGHTVTVARDGEEALALLLAGDFQVAVIDIGLPGIDGHAVARTARERLGARAPRLVAMTGYSRPLERDASARAGFDVHLVKPVEASDLVAAIETDLLVSGPAR